MCDTLHFRGNRGRNETEFQTDGQRCKEKGQVVDQKLQFNVGVLQQFFLILAAKLLIYFRQYDLPVEEETKCNSVCLN